MTIKTYKNYTLEVVTDPEDKVEKYGVRNIATGVVEAYLGDLPTAYHTAAWMDFVLDSGLWESDLTSRIEDARARMEQIAAMKKMDAPVETAPKIVKAH